jgi:hypothetical protein
MEIGMNKPLFCYRNHQLDTQDFRFIRELSARDFHLGRNNGNGYNLMPKAKEFAAPDLLLCLEEKDLLVLPPPSWKKIRSLFLSFINTDSPPPVPQLDKKYID